MINTELELNLFNDLESLSRKGMTVVMHYEDFGWAEIPTAIRCQGGKERALEIAQANCERSRC